METSRTVEDPNMPDDQIQFRDKDGKCVGLIYNIGKPKAIEPDAFTSPSHEARKRHGIASAIGSVSTNEGWMTKIEVPKWNPSFYMRSLGYTANPATCFHMHKRFKTRWICADCGEELPNG